MKDRKDFVVVHDSNRLKGFEGSATREVPESTYMDVQAQDHTFHHQSLFQYVVPIDLIVANLTNAETGSNAQMGYEKVLQAKNGKQTQHS
jgi:hypothetical protein